MYVSAAKLTLGTIALLPTVLAQRGGSGGGPSGNGEAVCKFNE